ncbi:hypothetical protein BS47DRAFT_138810 [Hydnum rufescens UP504]|uniref:Protein BFR2 n=1 Tax=Hydnum rufescens UP504 TaxID=1448309 RepID=A0A9P6AQK7_9AGAM|nr:hypothetical protein BS47DRAFT_138810 [Hydnum rufescens UP504]
MAPLSLAQQIAQLNDTIPTQVDLEDEYAPPDGSDVENNAKNNEDAAREHYVSVGPSAIRNLQPSVSDSKYEGVATSRSRIFDDEDDGHSGEDDDSREDDEDSDNVTDPSRDNSPSDEGEAETLNTPNEPKKASPPPPPDTSTSAQDLTSSLKHTRDLDRLKGQAVSKQLRLWDSLLDARIRLQKGVAATNQLPRPNQLPPFVSTESGTAAIQRLLNEALSLSDEIFELQEVLLQKQDVLVPPRKKRRVESEDHDLEAETYAASADFAQLESTTHPHTLQILQKWSNKIQSVSPAALLPSKRTTFRQQAVPKSTIDLIQEAVDDGRAKAVGRTRVRRAAGVGRIGDVALATSLVGEGLFKGGTGEERDKAPEEGDAEIFDDTDFYQEMLRDVIDSKTAKDGIVAEAWELNRANKVKKVVDTKASKGRKLRYEVHEKIKNFMVPVLNRGTWHEEQIDELFASLLGKGFESVNRADKDHPMDGDGPTPLHPPPGLRMKLGWQGYAYSSTTMSMLPIIGFEIWFVDEYLYKHDDNA